MKIPRLWLLCLGLMLPLPALAQITALDIEFRQRNANNTGWVTFRLADPGADRLVMWDDSAGRLAYVTVGTGLQLSGTTLSATGGGSLPDQTGHSGEFLTTNGTTASWAAIPGGGDVLAANNLSEYTGTSDTALGNLGATTVGINLLKAGTAADARTNLGIPGFDSADPGATNIFPQWDDTGGEVDWLSAANFKIALSLTKTDVGLNNVDNTADADKPVSTATQTAIDLKASLGADNSFTGSNTFGNAGTDITTVNGVLVLANGIQYSDAAMGALAVDTNELNNTKTVTADSTLTFNTTPAAGTVFGLEITNSDSAAHVITIPSSYSYALGATRTSFTLAAGSTASLTWRYNGSTYAVAGDPVSIVDLTEDTSPDGANDYTETYDASAGVHKKVKLENLPPPNGLPDVWVIPIGDETTAITTGTAKVTFRAPYAATVTAVRASLTTASSSGTPTFDINDGGTTILSTKLTIDSSETTSVSAATAAVISDTALADDAPITIDVDTAGTDAAGAKIAIYVTRD